MPLRKKQFLTLFVNCILAILIYPLIFLLLFSRAEIVDLCFSEYYMQAIRLNMYALRVYWGKGQIKLANWE